MKTPILLLIPLVAVSCVSLLYRWDSHECPLVPGDPRPDRGRIARVTSIRVQGSTLTAEGETMTAGFQQARLRQLPGAGLSDTRTYEFVTNPPPPGAMTLQVISPTRPASVSTTRESDTCVSSAPAMRCAPIGSERCRPTGAVRSWAAEALR